MAKHILYSKRSGIPARRARCEHAEHTFSYVSSTNKRSNNAGNLSAKSISIIFGILLCLNLTGCIGLNKDYVSQQKYGLTAAPIKPIGKKSEKILEVYYPEISSQFSGSNFVYRSDELKYTSDYYNMFFVSPFEQIYKNELKSLQSSQLFKYTSGNAAPLKPDYILKSYVSELYADYRNPAFPKAVMTIQFVLIDVSSPIPKIIFNKTLSKNQMLQQKSSEALIIAWNQELSSILRQLMFAIQKNIVTPHTAL